MSRLSLGKMIQHNPWQQMLGYGHEFQIVRRSPPHRLVQLAFLSPGGEKDWAGKPLRIGFPG